eukprot:UN13417
MILALCWPAILPPVPIGLHLLSSQRNMSNNFRNATYSSFHR